MAIASISNQAPPLKAVEIFANHIRSQLARFRSSAPVPSPPLFVALQGPQGSGKTTITRSLVSHLRSSDISVGVLSTDDLYHTHFNLVRVRTENPSNPLLSGRGQPGTHDIELGNEVLENVYRINEGKKEVTLPVFDKSQFKGEGDRAGQGVRLQPPLDVFILEGWSMGFAPIAPLDVEAKRNAAPPDSPLRRYTVEHLQQINRNLADYTRWYQRFNVFLQIKPTRLDHVYRWRLEQEHAMKAANGGQGMDDAAVKA